MKFSTPIKREFWKMKMDDVAKKGYFWEYKEDTSFWSRIIKLQIPAEGVFLVASQPFRVIIGEIKRCRHKHVPERYAAAIRTEFVWALKCYPERKRIEEVKRKK